MLRARALILSAALTVVSASTTRAAIDTTAQGGLNRTLALLAFSDDGARALLLERSGFGPFSEAVWIVDKHGVVEILDFGVRGATRGPGPAIQVGRAAAGDGCRAAAERLSDMAADFDQISVRVGMCGSATGHIVSAMKTWAPQVPSADVGALQRQAGLAGRTFIAPRGPTREDGPLVVVIGTDVFGNDRVGVTVRNH